MIKLCKAIIGYCCAILCKRGELRYGDILPAPKLSSSSRVLKYLSSCVLLKLSLRGEHLCSTWQSQLNKRISRDAHVSPMGFLSMTINVVVFSLFILFPNLSYSATVFLPDVQNEEVFSTLSTPPVVSIDSVRCEEVGYTYYASGVCPAYHNQDTCVFSDKYLKCDAEGWCRDNSYTISSCTSPKVVNTQCPNGLSLYKSCVCPSTYKYACTGTGYSSGNGTVCESKYTKCNCSTNYVWSGSACVCDSSFKYSCSGTGYSSGSGASCGGKYKSCNCSTYYSWNGSACAHVHSYVCPSGYSTSSSGMISPVSASKVCQLSGCSSTSGTCYKEGHTHSYSCPSGSYSSSSSCSYGTSGRVSKVCSCGATSSSKCYKCATHSHSYSCPSGSYSSSSSCSYGTSGTTSKVCSCGATSSGTCYYCASAPAHTHDYTCPYSWYTFSPNSDPCTYGYDDKADATCSSCGDVYIQACYDCTSICSVNPCADGCYRDRNCDYGCAEYNTCGGCETCDSAPCPRAVCTSLGGTYSGGSCSVDCSSRRCWEECYCVQNGGEWIDGYCTNNCTNVCMGEGGLA